MSDFVKILNNRKNREDSRQFVFALVFVVLWFFTVLLYTNDNFIYVDVIGDSMQNTLHTGDVLYGNTKCAPTYGDIVLIGNVKHDGNLIKRIIGLPGDTIVIKEGKVFRNGAELYEPYIKVPDSTYCEVSLTHSEEVTFELGEGEIFFLGDNRGVSLDARRYWFTARENCRLDNVFAVITPLSLRTKGVTRFVAQLSASIRAALRVN